MTCCFFGHADSPLCLLHDIKSAAEKLIIENEVDTFYVGDKGSFDRMALSVVKALAKEYPHIQYGIVLAYLPTKKQKNDEIDPYAFLPEGIELGHPRFAITRRNNWMADHADYVICFSQRNGRSSQFINRAKRKGSSIIRLKLNSSHLANNHLPI